MGALVFAARVTVAFVLAYAAFAKLHEAARLPGQMRAIGVPAPLSVAAAVVVPTVELVIALALLGFPYSPVPAFAAIVLLALFTGVVIANLAGEDRKPCPCFGAVAVDRPVSSLALVRNAWLLALAIIATGDPTGDSGALYLPVLLLLALATLFVVWVTS
ncbi:MAG TPA: MauE/DoxX family redox-associated membrane protein [Acidimicrobiia bacterium]|nr:MauE/DoxX family redox-associated membrane protein [Acidimicrobiia bacterium]